MTNKEVTELLTDARRALGTLDAFDEYSAGIVAGIAERIDSWLARHSEV